MKDRSFMRLGGVLGILLAVDSLLAVGVYFGLVPAAQRLIPFQGAEALLASLAQDPAPMQLYYLLFSLVPVFTILPLVAVYFRVRATTETWSLFAVLLAVAGSFFWMVYGFQQFEFFRFLAVLYPQNPVLAVQLFSAPAVLNPLNGVTGGFISVWFLITGAQLLRTDANKLISLVAFIAFADLLVGFLANLAGVASIGGYTGAIAGAVGGPLFWVLMGLDLLKHAEPAMTKQGMPTLASA